MRISGFAVIAAATASILAAPASARDRLLAASFLPPTHQYSQYLYKYWAERVKHYSKGTLAVEVEMGSQRITALGAMAELADGLVDVSLHAAQYTPGDLPVANAVEELGMTFSDSRVVIAAATEFNMTDPEQKAEWARHGVVYGGAYTTMRYRPICNKRIGNLAEFRGTKIRLPGRAPAEWANSAGGATVAFDSNEQYGALDKGALTCTTTTLADAYTRKLHEVARHVTDLPITLFWAGYGLGYNKAVWAELTVSQRRAALYAAADAMAKLIVETRRDEVQAREKMQAAGVVFHDPAADLVDSIAKFRDKQAGSAAKVAKDKFRIIDPVALLSRFQATVAKWEGLLKGVPDDDQNAFADLLRSEIFDRLDLKSYGMN